MLNDERVKVVGVGLTSDFYRYFKENMEGLGLPAPETLYGNLQLALANATAMAKYVDQFGTRVTVREMVKAGTRLEQLATAGAVSAAFYVGAVAVIGSIAVAAGRTLSGGVSMSDVLCTAARCGVNASWLQDTYLRYPGIYNTKAAHRPIYRLTAVV